MRTPLTLEAAGWLPAVTALAAGLAWHDCVLVAGSTVLAVFAFRQGMERNAPWQGWRAAVRCIIAGAAMIAAALGLLLFVGGVVAGWWPPRGARSNSAGLVLLAIAVLLVLFKVERPRGDAQFRAGAAVGIAAAAPWFAAARGLPYAACAFATGVALWLGHGGWRLSHDLAAELASDDGRN